MKTWVYYTAIVPLAGVILAAAAMALTHDYSPQAAAAVQVRQVAAAMPNGIELEAPDTCQRRAVAAALARMPRDTGYRWVWGDLKHVAAGETYPTQRVVVLDPATACRYMPSITYHEWMHTAGALTGGDYRGTPLAEADADCGNVLLFRAHPAGTLWDPYVHRFGGCTAALYAQARAIMAGR